VKRRNVNVDCEVEHIKSQGVETGATGAGFWLALAVSAQTPETHIRCEGSLDNPSARQKQ